MSFSEEVHERVKNIEGIIRTYLPEDTGYQKTVIDAMNYSILAGGKRLRPMLMQETYKMFGGNKSSEIEPFMAAIEMIHTYSLVHDDLPAMDNDEYRRGKKTTHAVYGEAFGILAGDGLLNYAFETALIAFEDGENLERKAMALKVLATKAGIYGMIGGQTADIEAENMNNQVTLEHLLFIHEHKTAALIQASMLVGAILAGAKQDELEKIEKAGYDIGVAFQIQDDILDVTSTTEVLGKPVGSDEKNGKTTYVSLKGIDEAMEDQKKMSRQAIKLLNSLNKGDAFLLELVESLITRVK